MSDIPIEEVYEEIKDYTLGHVNVALPGVVMAYDHAKQRASVQPVIRYREVDPYGEETTTLPQPVPGIPVLFPQGGGYSDAWPLEAGDFVLLVFCDRNIDGFLATGSSDNDPKIVRRFNYSDAVAIPGIRPFSAPLEAVDEDARVLAGPAFKFGSELADEPLTTAQQVLDRLNALENAFNTFITTTFNTHTHVGNMGAPTGPSVPVGTTVALTSKSQLELPLIKVP